MKKLLSIIIFFFLSINIYSQNNTINGYVSDLETGEKLVNATVFVDNKNATVTNEYGYFSLILPKLNADTVIITANYLGYASKKIKFNLKGTGTINFSLQPDNQIDSVIITGQIPNTQTTEIGALTIPINQLKIMPTIGSESDIFKSLQMMPGVQSGTEGKSNLFVRGGACDENLILLDDVPLYYVNHLGGFVSIFNTDALSSVKMLKGGFPARYGSRLSSVVDVRMKDGDLKNYHGNYAIGLTSIKILYEGPIIKDKSSFIISGRIFPLNWLTKPFTFLINDGQMIGYNFYDVNAKLNYKINAKNNLFLSFYTGDDNFSFDLSKLYSGDQSVHYVQKWGNNLFAFRWNHIFNSKLFLNTSISFTRFRFLNKLKVKSTEDTSSYVYNFNTGIKDYSLKATFDYNTAKFYKIKFGINSIIHSFNPGISYFKITKNDFDSSYTNSTMDEFIGFENIFFIENNLSIGSFFKANLGLHISDFYSEKTNYISYEPRIVINFNVNKNLSVKASYSEMQQFVHLLTNNTIGITPDIWVPSNANIKPSEGKQASFGIFKHFEKKDIDFEIVTYYKVTDNLITYKEGEVFTGNAENWQQKIETGGNGLSFGLEFLLQKKQGLTTGWISYTYSKTTQQFDNINFGQIYPFKYDRRHDFSVVVNQKINDKITVSADWVFGSGYPYTLPIGVYNTIDDGTLLPVMKYDFIYDQKIYIYSDRNAYRMRVYHRLDLAANFTKKVKKGIRTWTFSVYNAYNRSNPYLYYTKYDKNDKKIRLYQQSLFPIIPSLSYSLEF